MTEKKIAGICPCCESTDTRLIESTYENGIHIDHMICDEDTCGVEWKETFVYQKFEIVKKEAGHAAKRTAD